MPSNQTDNIAVEQNAIDNNNAQVQILNNENKQKINQWR